MNHFINPSSDISDLNILLRLIQNEYNSVKDVIFLLLITIIYVNMLINFKLQMQSSFIYSLNKTVTNTEITKELNCLRLRTVHCKGLLLTDVKGTLLKRKIYEYLESIKDNGKILAIIVFPDYSRLLKLEKQRLAIKDLEMIYTMEERKPSCFQRCFPQTFNSLEEYERKFIEVEKSMQEEIESVIESSGQCFICFNNMKTAENCLRKFNSASPLLILYTFFINLRNRCCLKRNEHLERGFFSEISMKRKISTLNKYSESVYQEEEDKANTKAFMPIMTIAPDPHDINWLNITSASLSFQFFRRLLTNLSIILLMLFLTTPVSLFQVFIEEISLDWISEIPHPFNEIFLTLLPSLIVTLANQIILLVIDYSSELECYCSFSGYQISNLRKGIFYMLLNLLLLPVLTIGTAESLFMIFVQGFSLDWTGILTKFFTSSTLWSFYLMMLLEQGVLSFICYVLRLKEWFLCLGDATFAYYKRAFLNDKAVWRREVDDIFQYGYFSAQMIVCLTIVFVFGYQYPIVLIAGMLYFLFRHLGDAYNVLVVNQNEMNSHGKFIVLVIIYSFLPISLEILFNIGWLIIEQKWITLGYVAVCAVFVIFIAFRTKRNLCNTANFRDDQVINELKKATKKWQEFYEHPLIIPNFLRFEDEKEGKLEKTLEEDEKKEAEGKKGKRKKKEKVMFWNRPVLNLENVSEY